MNPTVLGMTTYYRSPQLVTTIVTTPRHVIVHSQDVLISVCAEAQDVLVSVWRGDQVVEWGPRCDNSCDGSWR